MCVCARAGHVEGCFWVRTCRIRQGGWRRISVQRRTALPTRGGLPNPAASLGQGIGTSGSPAPACRIDSTHRSSGVLLMLPRRSLATAAAAAAAESFAVAQSVSESESESATAAASAVTASAASAAVAARVRGRAFRAAVAAAVAEQSSQ